MENDIRNDMPVDAALVELDIIMDKMQDVVDKLAQFSDHLAAEIIRSQLRVDYLRKANTRATVILDQLYRAGFNVSPVAGAEGEQHD